VAYVMSVLRFIIPLCEGAHSSGCEMQGDPLSAHVASPLYRHDGQIVFCKTHSKYGDKTISNKGDRMSIHKNIHI